MNVQYISCEIGSRFGDYLVRLELIYYKKIAVGYVVYVSVDEEALSAAEAEKQLAAFVDMYLRIRLLPLGIEQSEAFGVGGVFYGAGTAFKIAFHAFCGSFPLELGLFCFNYIYYITKW